jgi:hypothetical protein
MVSRLDELTATNEYSHPNRIQDKTIYDTEDIIDKTTETKKESVMYNFTVINQKSLECKNIFIDSLNSEVYKLKKPIPVCIEYDGETYIANNYDLGLYGYDDMELEAIEDLKKSIIECYEDLKNETELGPVPKRMMVYYKEIIEEK